MQAPSLGSTATICALPRLTISKLRARLLVDTRRDSTSDPRLQAYNAVELLPKVAPVAPTITHHGDWISNPRPTSPACRATDTESWRRHIELPASTSELSFCLLRLRHTDNSFSASSLAAQAPPSPLSTSTTQASLPS